MGVKWQLTSTRAFKHISSTTLTIPRGWDKRVNIGVFDAQHFQFILNIQLGFVLVEVILVILAQPALPTTSTEIHEKINSKNIQANNISCFIAATYGVSISKSDDILFLNKITIKIKMSFDNDDENEYDDSVLKRSSISNYLKGCCDEKSNIISNCVFFHSGSVEFCELIGSKLDIIPVDFKIELRHGNIISVNDEHSDELKDLIFMYSTFIVGTIDYVTSETMSLKLFRCVNYNITHNIFTSILFTLPIMLNITKQKLIS